VLSTNFGHRRCLFGWLQCSECSRWVLPGMLSLTTSKRPLGTVAGAGLYGACTRYSGRRASAARLAPRH
jgi:hypothetical protein